MPGGKRISRYSAAVAGGLAGVGFGTLGLCLYLAATNAQTPLRPMVGVEGLATIAVFLPAFLLIGLLFAMPSAAIMVLVLAALVRRWRPFDHVLVWIAAGVLFAWPTAELGFAMESGGGRFGPLFSLGSILLMTGGVSGFCAWLYRRPQDHRALGE
ncbi:hypothetical protein H7F50_10335 [Novosphingobium flavum]|uniref:Uncharacterized protein n=1 Tax=Novosphingobium aerophilum TaxID=2839843 RepID=A0A7X1F5F5_9SPHN|nr:hypothetical protein [Novosphingobium aerophilum]MBC2650678.1 hypothetical protein [Novosphingobium aerophilum]MBC2662158.1 hypothetical protein [Novosphingobium aerophilum]